MKRTFRLALAIAAGGPTAIACRHALLTPTPVGATTFRFLEPPPSHESSPATDAREDRTPMSVIAAAVPIEPLGQPVYPSRALAAHANAAVVAVQLTIDATGRVTDIGPSFRELTTPGRWEGDFKAAVEAAVKDWRFYPAQRQLVQRAKLRDGSDTLLIRRSEPIESTVDVAFNFAPTGVVLPSF